MTRDRQHNPDPNENAARIAAGSEARHAADAPSGDVEAAWREWSSHKRRWPAIAARLLMALTMAGIALICLDTTLVALQVQGPPYARVSHAREIAAQFGVLDIAALIAAAWNVRAAVLNSK
jgi:hypothetical protein